jgi:hypothetical protein
MKLSVGIVPAILLALPAYAQSASNLVVNGGFELPAGGYHSVQYLWSIPGWAWQAGCQFEIQNHVAGSPLEGAQHLELDSFCNTAISQDLNTQAGRTYQVSFGYSPRPGVTNNRIRFYWDGQLIVDTNVNGVGLQDTQWQRITATVTAPRNGTRIMFVDAGDSDSVGGYIDAVHVSEAGGSCSESPEAPTLTLLGSSEMTLECGVDTWVDPGARAEHACGLMEVLKYNSGDDDGDGVPGAQDPDDHGPGPNAAAEGTYSVQYAARTPQGGTVSALRTVHVDDRIAPVLKLKGAAQQTHTCGTGWVDPGVEASDACYGNLAADVKVSGYVNGWSAGSYTLTYTLTDSGNNAAAPVTRTVDVVNCPW